MINCKSNELTPSLKKTSSIMKKLYSCKLLSYFQVVSIKHMSSSRPCQGYKRHERGNLVLLAEPVLYIVIRSFYKSGKRAIWFYVFKVILLYVERSLHSVMTSMILTADWKIRHRNTAWNIIMITKMDLPLVIIDSLCS